jgi:hypothetical protein
MLEIDSPGQHVRHTVAAMVREQQVTIPEKGAGSHTRGLGTLPRVIKANQLTGGDAAIHHLVVVKRPDDITEQRFFLVLVEIHYYLLT